MKIVTDMIISLTNLYGIVHREKVVEIYNQQHEALIDEDVLDMILEEATEELGENNIVIRNGYFVHEAVMEADGFEELRLHQAGIPHYVPEPKELMKYRDELYFEENEAYQDLLLYVTETLTDGDRLLAELICEDIQNICRFGFDIHAVLDELSLRKISFRDEEQMQEMVELVLNLANNTRLWENNGHTLNELVEMNGKPTLTVIPGGKK